VPGSLLNTSPVTWGDVNTVAKRCGTNTIDGSMNNITVGGFTSNLLFTQFNTDVGDTEAALTLYDSGSALFRYTGSEWMLVGLGVYVEGNGSSAASTQGDSANSEDNYFIRISSYANAPDQIGAVLVPEPCSWHLLLGGLLFLGLFAFRRSFHREA
ncbi:MAG: hypothetical protein NTZ01_07520, partial [Verrucomicrobia bacterium]|nr:hypothetical protein [Verrucomicrobiota bacterium]